MAISANAVWEIWPTSGSDTNGGGFDPSIATGVSDFAATVATGNAPVITSATYNFVAGDVGAWVFVKSGTNWVPGFYKISSVAANAATVNGTIGQAILYQGATVQNTVAGCATTASPTGGTGSVDYTQQAVAAVAVTGESSATTTITTLAAAFTPVMVGNALYLSGTGITTGRYFMTVFTSTTVCTVDRSPGTTGTSVVVNIGGALATNNQAFGTAGGVGGNVFWIKNTGTMAVSGSQTALPAGVSGALTVFAGYNSLRGDLDAAKTFTNHPLVQNNNVVNNTINLSNAYVTVRNITADGGVGGSKAQVNFLLNANDLIIVNCKALNFTIAGFEGFGGNFQTLDRCWGTANVAGATGAFYFTLSTIRLTCCVATANTCHGFNSIASTIIFLNCISANNTGASTDGFNFTGVHCGTFVNCVSYTNGRDGLRAGAGGLDDGIIRNCIFVSNGGYGINSSSTNYQTRFNYMTEENYNFFYNNTSGARNNMPTGPNDVTLTGDPFTNGAGGDFSLNNTAGAGASVRAAGFPGTFSGIGTTGFLDGGAVQHTDPAGGGGVVKFAGDGGGFAG